MNTKVILIKGDLEKAVQLLDNCILTTTRYETSYDAECIYSSTKADLKKKGWRTKPAVISKIENAPRRKKFPKPKSQGLLREKTAKKEHKWLGHRIHSDETVGE